jgi:hypothetical protein
VSTWLLFAFARQTRLPGEWAIVIQQRTSWQALFSGLHDRCAVDATLFREASKARAAHNGKRIARAESE